MSHIPSAWPFALLTLAAYRSWRLFAEDLILAPLRDWWIGAKKGASFMSDFISCAWCFGAWSALGWWIAWLVWPHGALIAAVPFALSAAVGTLASLFAALAE